MFYQGAAAGSGSGLGIALVGKSRLETRNVQIKREAHVACFSGKLKIVVACSQKIGEHPPVVFSCWETLTKRALSCRAGGEPSRST